MGSAAGRVAESVGSVFTAGFDDLARADPRHFTRRRKLSPGAVVAYVACRRGASMGLELRRLSGEGLPLASAPAVSRARRKVSRDAVASLAPAHAARVYRDGDFLTLPGGLLPVAVDATTVPVPTNAATLAAFGSPGCVGGARRQASMGLSCAYDALNGLVLSLEECPGSMDERSFVAGHVERAREVAGGAARALFLPGRGCPSLPLLAAPCEAGASFVARCGAGFLSAESARCAEAGGDLEVRVELTRSRLKDHPPEVRDALAGTVLRLRLAVVDAGGPAPEMLATNVPADLLRTAPALAAARSWRWPVETCFQKLKGRPRLETAWTSPDPALIARDAHVAARLLNMAEGIAAGATAAARARGARRGNEPRASVSWCAGALRQDLPALLRASPGLRLALARRLVREAASHLEPVRPWRRSPREGLRRGCGRRPSNTHKPAF